MFRCSPYVPLASGLKWHYSYPLTIFVNLQTALLKAPVLKNCTIHTLIQFYSTLFGLLSYKIHTYIFRCTPIHIFPLSLRAKMLQVLSVLLNNFTNLHYPILSLNVHTNMFRSNPKHCLPLFKNIHIHMFRCSPYVPLALGLKWYC